MKDDIGNRMKENYESRTRYMLPRRTYTIIRVDGKAFHTFTRGCEKPFSRHLMETMDRVAEAMCRQIQGVCLAYTQSDEISLVLTDFSTPGTDAWFNGNVQKMASIAASIATAEFNRHYYAGPMAGTDMDSAPLAMFDARVFTIPDATEVENYLIWRQNDATRNSLQMAARAVYSHKRCENKNTASLHDMLHQAGINWNDYTSGEKRGRCTVNQSYVAQGKDKKGNVCEALRSRWVTLDGLNKTPASETPIFTQDRDFLKRLIPRLTEPTLQIA